MEGKPVDGRKYFTAKEVRGIAKLTNSMIADRGHSPTVKLGHKDFIDPGREKEVRHGFLENITVGKRKLLNGQKRTTIFADAIVDKELSADLKAGKYSSLSAELYPLNWMEKDSYEEIEQGEWYLDAVAYLGEITPGFPELTFSAIRIDPRQEKSMDPRIELKAMMEKFAADSASENFGKEESLAALEEIKAKADEVAAYIEEQEDDSDGDDDADAGADDSATDDNAATKVKLAAAEAEIVKLKAEVKGNHKQPKDQPAPNAQLAAMQAEIDALKKINSQSLTDARDQVFNGLVADGKITKGERDVFDAIADKKGDDYARMHYAAQSATKGPQSKLFASITNAPDDPEYRKFMASLERAGLNKDEMQAHSDEYRKLVAEGQIPSTAGVN
jgi:hypothetical protein